MKNSDTKDFVAYEYLSLNVKSERELLYIDCYESLGWMLVNNTSLVDMEDYYINSINNSKLINIKFKRDRRIKNKGELLSLQIKLEISLKEVDRLENQPNSLGMIWALVMGLIGTIFLTFSVFTITASDPLYIVGMINGIIGLVGWALGYFAYKAVKSKKEQDNISLIEEQYNTIYDCCEQASKLLNN